MNSSKNHNNDYSIFKKTFVIFLALNFALAQNSGAGLYFYRIQKGDQLGILMRRLGVCPIWGKNGSVAKIAESHPWAVFGKNNQLIKDQILKLELDSKKFDSDVRVTAQNELKMLTLKTYPNCNDIRLNQLVQASLDRPRVQPQPQVVHAQPERAPAGLEVAESPEILGGFLEPTIGLGALSVYAVDKTNQLNALLVTRSAYTLGVNWKQLWSPSSTFTMAFAYQKLDFIKPEGVELRNSNLSLLKMNSTYSYLLSPSMNFDFSTGIEQLPQIQALESTSLTLASPWVLTFSGALKNKFRINSFYELGTHLEYGVVGPSLIASQKTDLGQFVKVKAFSLSHFSKFDFKVGAEYQYRKFSDTLTSTAIREVIMNIGISFPLYFPGGRRD